MLPFSMGNGRRVEFPGVLRASLAGDRARGGASGCPKMFPFPDSVTCQEEAAALYGVMHGDTGFDGFDMFDAVI